jgi:hypothetical protein
MMKRLFILYFVVCFVSLANCEHYWQKEETQVLQLAKKENLPIIAVFIGQQGCPWSKKLQEEVLEHPHFSQQLLSDAILWQVALSGEEKDKAIREQYHIQTAPIILLLDPQGKEFARMEYAPFSASEYATEINSLIEHFQEICVALAKAEVSFDEASWQNLYKQSKAFSVPCFAQVILERGVQQEKGTFFHLEKLATLLEKHKLKHPAVLKCKKQLLERDPNNQFGTQFKIAALEFNKLMGKSKNNDHPEKVIAPLLQYIHQFGKTDQENLWKAELMVAKYLSGKKLFAQALEYAQASHEVAPESAKPQILQTMNEIQGN